MTNASDLNIGEMARLHGISLRTLRFYEEKGLLTPRRIGQTRYYAERDEARLKLILHSKRMGFTLTEITQIIARKEASSQRAAEPIAVLTRSQIEAQIAILVQRRGMTEVAIRELQAALSDHRVAESA